MLWRVTEAVITEEATEFHKVYLSTIEEVVEHAKAADTLGLGFRIESYSVVSKEEPDNASPEFEFTLLNDLPVRQDED
jgi:hypothetical protein